MPEQQGKKAMWPEVIKALLEYGDPVTPSELMRLIDCSAEKTIVRFMAMLANAGYLKMVTDQGKLGVEVRYCVTDILRNKPPTYQEVLHHRHSCKDNAESGGNESKFSDQADEQSHLYILRILSDALTWVLKGGVGAKTIETLKSENHSLRIKYDTLQKTHSDLKKQSEESSRKHKHVLNKLAKYESAVALLKKKADWNPLLRNAIQDVLRMDA